MKLLTPLLLCLSIAATTYAQYEVGVPVYDTIYNGFYYRLDDCAPEEDVNIGPNEEVLNFVTGLELVMIITAIEGGQGSITTDDGEFFVNDSLPINASTPFHSFYLYDVTSFEFSLIAKGIPQVPNESYPCQIEAIISLAHCQNGYTIMPYPFSDYCEVQEGVITSNSTPTSSLEDHLKVFPNPARTSLNIKSDHLVSTPNISLLDAAGRPVLAFETQVANDHFELDISALKAGIYFLQLAFQDQVVVRKVMVY